MSSILDILFKSSTQKAGVGASMTSGFSSGRDIGSGTDRPGGSASATASAVPSARSALLGGSAGGGTSSPKPAAARPAGGSLAPSAAPAQAAPSSSGPSVPGFESNAVKAMHNDAEGALCKCPSCAGMAKGMTTKKYGVPFYLRKNAFDKNDLERSATAQTSSMYTSIAPEVANELNMAVERGTAAAKNSALKSQDAASSNIKKVREEMADRANTPRTSLKFSR